MKTILITGANGFVCWYLIRDLLQKDCRIIATGKGPSRLQFADEKLQYVSLDFTDSAQVDEVFKNHKPNIIVHAGAESKPDGCELHREAAYATNVQGTEHLLRAAASCKSYFLYLSTDFVFAGERLEYKEADALGPVNYYGETKRLAEEAVQKYAFAWSIVRTVLVYGKPLSGRQNILTMVADALQNGTPLRIFSDQTRTPTYVEDLSGALVQLVEAGHEGVFHISGADIVTPYSMAVAVAQHLGHDPERIENVTAATFQQPALRPPITGFDLTKAKTVLHYKPTSFLEGLQKTFA